MKVLIADDDDSIRWVIRETARRLGWEVEEARDGEEALEKILKGNFNLVFLDVRMPRLEGMTVLEVARKSGVKGKFIIMTAVKSPEPAAKAATLGAAEYLTKPFELEDIERLLSEEEKPSPSSEHPLQEEGYLTGLEIVGTSPAIISLFQDIGKVAPLDYPVLITGERGTGKELVARTIHELSPFRDGNFVPVNVAAIPPELLESELFGYGRGAFTGAVTSKPGKVEAAQGGSLFLDEIGEMDPAFQAKLLRFIQDREFYRLGETTLRKFTGRIIAATNRNLEKLAKEGIFREDLLDRLSTFTLRVPSLAERREDIPLLADHFVRIHSVRLTGREKKITREAAEMLTEREWPGNVRELESYIIRLVVTVPGDTIETRHLSADLKSSRKSAVPPALLEDVSFEELVEAKIRNFVDKMGGELEKERNLLSLFHDSLEKKLIEIVLEKTGWNRVRTAQILGINRNTLHGKMKKLGITEKSRKKKR
ncbi:MAG: sigma-54-dependent Fis family transcriptional regulator [Deltaproteobacteria bacterium]|nr:MAG: sigma-54-dependent Fis family transcriptional regulator [Deltaproteobacteria bacterium]